MALNKLVQVHGAVEHHGEIPAQDSCCTAALCLGESFCWDLGANLLDVG